MKIAFIALLAIGIIIVAPEIRMPAFTEFSKGGGPIIPGSLFPYLFITIACGAISGWHSLVGSGTTSKMVMKESHMKTIAVGGMLTEGFVSVMALIAATSLLPLDYFQINVPIDRFQAILPQLNVMGFTQSNFDQLCTDVGEKLAGRTGGGVSLGVGIAFIFSSIGWMKHLMSYWYHFVIVFEALFILTTIDAGTRIGMFLIQEAFGKIYKPFQKTNWLPGNILASGIIVFSWAYFIYTGTVSTIWPMFGAANQLLATIALAIGTSFIINRGRAKYAWMTIVPMTFVGINTLAAGFLNMKNIYFPQTQNPATFILGLVNLVLTFCIMVCVLIILYNAVPKWIKVIRNLQKQVPEPVPELKARPAVE